MCSLLMSTGEADASPADAALRKTHFCFRSAHSHESASSFDSFSLHHYSSSVRLLCTPDCLLKFYYKEYLYFNFYSLVAFGIRYFGFIPFDLALFCIWLVYYCVGSLSGSSQQRVCARHFSRLPASVCRAHASRTWRCRPPPDGSTITFGTYGWDTTFSGCWPITYSSTRTRITKNNTYFNHIVTVRYFVLTT